MRDTFTAAVVDEFGPTLKIREADLPEPGRNQALVRNLASGICHTDIQSRSEFFDDSGGECITHYVLLYYGSMTKRPAGASTAIAEWPSMVTFMVPA